MNQVKEAVSRGYLRAGVAFGGVLASAGAFAQSSDPFETALSTATEKVGTYAGALVGLSAVAVVFMLAIKYIKKIPKAG
jgi:hypothetical protein